VYAHECPFWQKTRVAANFAAESGDVKLMAWILRQPGTELNEAVMCAAASKGYAAMCVYLYDRQCPWNECSTCEAAVGGHVDVLRWLVDNGCPLNERPLRVAAVRSGSVKVLAYLQQLGLLSIPATLTSMLTAAAHYNKLTAAKWLREQGAEWPTKFKKWYPWRSEVLEWARVEGCITPMTESNTTPTV
jgi:hypothetical protein